MDDPLAKNPTQSDVAQALGYTRNLGAASLAARRSSVLGVVLPDLRNPFFESIVEALQAEADTTGLLPLIATASDNRSHEAAILHHLRELRVAGVVIVSPVEALDDLARAGRSMCMVLVGADGTTGSLDSVHVDETAAARLIVDHARTRSWRRIIALSEEAGSGDIWVDLRRTRDPAAAATGIVRSGSRFDCTNSGESL